MFNEQKDIRMNDKFTFHHDWWDSLSELGNAEKLAAYEAIFLYAFEGIEPTDSITRAVTKLIFSGIDAQNAKANALKIKRSEAGKKHKGNQYSRPENGTNGTSVPKMEQNGTNGTSVPISRENVTEIPTDSSKKWNKCSKNGTNGTSVPIKEEKKETKKEEIPPHPPIEEKNKEKKEESLGDKTSLSPCPFDKQTDLPDVTPENENIDWGEIVLFFNEKVKNKSIPPIKLMTDRRKQAVRARIREYGFEAIKTAIINAAESEFMNGRNRKNWTATFDWIFLPNNFPKVLEDNYKNKYNTYGTSTEYSGYIAPELRAAQERREQEERLAARIQRLAEEDGGGW